MALPLLPTTAWSHIAPNECNDFGGDHATPSDAFIPLGDRPVVRHMATGLEWQRCAIGQEWHDGACVGEAETLNWEEAREAAQSLGGGWRLPQSWELQSIVEYCRVAPSINRRVFPDQPLMPASVWSGTPYAGTTGYAWSFRFSTGEGSWGPKTRSSGVRLVRDGPVRRILMAVLHSMPDAVRARPQRLLSHGLDWQLPAGLVSIGDAWGQITEAKSSAACFHEDIPRRTPTNAFDMIGDGETVLHRSTGLEWQRCAIGQHWNNGRCEGKAAVFDWETAQEVAAESEDGWRLPTISELLTIAEPCRAAPAINRRVFPGITEHQSAFWSSTPYAGSDTYAWDADFADGSSGWTRRTLLLGIRLVRERS